jgi:hypothetical protein
MTAITINSPGSEEIGHGRQKIVDLFSESSAAPPQVTRRVDGRTVVSNATVIDLEKYNDVERIIGVLLGRMSVRREMKLLKQRTKELLSTEEFLPLDLNEVSEESTMLITIHVSPVAVGKLAPMDFHFICPHGDLWPSPSIDICLFSEMLGTYPRSPPPSLTAKCVLAQLILSPAMPADFLLVANISNSNENANNNILNSYKTIPKFSSAVSVNSFRSSIPHMRPQVAPVVTQRDSAANRIDLIHSALQTLRVLSHVPNTV